MRVVFVLFDLLHQSFRFRFLAQGLHMRILAEVSTDLGAYGLQHSDHFGIFLFAEQVDLQIEMRSLVGLPGRTMTVGRRAERPSKWPLREWSLTMSSQMALVMP